MRVARSDNVLRIDEVAESVASIGALIVSDGSAIGTTAPDAASPPLFDLARSETSLAWERVALWVGIYTVEVGRLYEFISCFSG